MLSAAKHLALLLLDGKVQSEILRFAQNDSEGLRMRPCEASAGDDNGLLFGKLRQ
jgi:hypothetical protein